MKEPIYDPRRPHCVGIECPRCGRVQWIDAIMHYSATHETWEQLAFEDCEHCQQERKQQQDKRNTITHRSSLAYPSWSPVIGPEIVLEGEML